ncbi:dephospho-CoA kinase [Roseivivax sp. GX 12232]|uniref:dephospho-CoA kinase n=1 Tax=Roseivivax sp. GX 12232 TaxID=2900547 RepID=UPI001E5D696F|nr:dephospho-CoA kinase [Roseivivax sp. GX 12232]MCE0506281.1 dephospho-CoA kinase [Roseivivax sp. GX 12232]
MSFRLGLTGSIGMGKTTTAGLFAEAGCAVWDADAAVHRLYAKGGAAVAPIGAAFPDALVEGAISRPALRRIIAADPGALTRIEEIVHPLVRADREAFAEGAEAQIVVFDIPLLFETGGQAEMDATACVYVSHETQRARVLERGTMSEADFEAILAKQMPIQDKLDRADFTIRTQDLETARMDVQDVLTQIEKRL